MSIITFQPELRPALPCVIGSKEYHEFRDVLVEMDRILAIGSLEDRIIAKQIAAYDDSDSPRHLSRHCKTLRQALRHSILLGLTGYSYRKLAQRLPDSLLFQWFTHTGYVDAIRSVSKSTVERYDKMFDADIVAELIHELNSCVADELRVNELLYRKEVLRMDAIFADTTCVKANIHFPVDWILLRDAARTLVGAIIHIRNTGLRHRIGSPEKFIREMNKLCIEMTHTRKKRNGKTARKMILRRMKKLMKIIEGHARNYHCLLKERRDETGWSELESRVVLERIENILDQLPQAIKQAHERIIGERRVSNSDKILSFYEPDIHVLVRGKAGAEVEFGNGLYLAEQADGLIVDWEFMKDQPKSDSKLVEPSISRITENYGVPESYSADRGFCALSNDIILEDLDIINGICPRSVHKLKEKLEDEEFCLLQKRRGNTEARIGIFKNAYLGSPLRSKGFANRKTRIVWCILSHNLWKIASMAARNRAQLETELSKAA